jgi:hypothetical protein
MLKMQQTILRCYRKQNKCAKQSRSVDSSVNNRSCKIPSSSEYSSIWDPDGRIPDSVKTSGSGTTCAEGGFKSIRHLIYRKWW